MSTTPVSTPSSMGMGSNSAKPQGMNNRRSSATRFSALTAFISLIAATGASTLFEFPSHVEHLLAVWLGNDALGGVKVERAFINLAGHARQIGPGKQGEKPEHTRNGDEPVIVQRDGSDQRSHQENHRADQDQRVGKGQACITNQCFAPCAFQYAGRLSEYVQRVGVLLLANDDGDDKHRSDAPCQADEPRKES